MVRVYEYVNYREYLKAYFQDRKARDPKFSHRFLARKLDLVSPTFMMLVMQGKRNITEELAARIATALKLSDKEGEYFACMIGFDQAKTPSEKDHYFTRMIELRKYSNVKKIEESQYEFYSNWYNIPIRELVTHPEFRGNYRWLAKKLIPSITGPQARRAVQLLLGLGLIRKKGKRFERTSRLMSTGDVVNSVAVVNFHRKMAEIAGASLDTVPKQERDITACTLNLDEQGFQVIRKIVAESRKKALSVAEAEVPAGRVYQINFQIYPVTKKNRELL